MVGRHPQLNGQDMSLSKPQAGVRQAWRAAVYGSDTTEEHYSKFYLTIKEVLLPAENTLDYKQRDCQATSLIRTAGPNANVFFLMAE